MVSLTAAIPHYAIKIVEKVNSVRSKMVMRHVNLIVEMVSLLEIKEVHNFVMMEIKFLEMDVTNAYPKDFGNAKYALKVFHQCVHSNVEMVYYSHYLVRSVMIIIEEMAMVVQQTALKFLVFHAQLITIQNQYVLRFVEMV
jgi:hypothetical protein